MTSEYNEVYSDVEDNSICEISDGNIQDVTKDLLTKEPEFEKQLTPLDYRNDTSTPNTIKHARSASSDATPVASAFSEGTLSLPHRRAYLNITETKEENKRLKSEVFDLKSQLFMLRRNLPSVVDKEGKDVTEEYLNMRAKLDADKVSRAEMEQLWQSQKKKFDEERSKFEIEKNIWEKKQEKILMDKDELANELKELRQQLAERQVERDDGSESQGDSSLSTVSLISERGMEIERLRSVVLQQSVDEKKLRTKMEHEIIQLQGQLKSAQNDLAKQVARYTEEKSKCESLKAEVTKLQNIADKATQEVEYQKQYSEEQLAKACADNELALNKRDRTIRILLKKLKSGDGQTFFSSKFEANSCPLHDLNLNPYAQGILEQINEFTAENDAIRKKVIEWGTVNIDLTSEIETSEALSAEDENSEWNTRRCERENEKLAAFLAQNRTHPDGSNEEELGGKLALFDAINGSEGRLKEQLDDTVRSIGASEMLNITSAADLFSKSLVLTEDFCEIKKKLSILQSVCTRLFEKLRGTANFLQTLLDELGAGERGKELLAEIETLRIDLDHSLATAIDISRDVEAAEESIGDLSAHLQRSLNCSFGISSLPSNENQQNISALSRAHREYRRLNAEFANEKTKASEAIALNEKLQTHVIDLEEAKQKLISELDELKKNMKEKENEMILSVNDIRAQLQEKNNEYDKLYSKMQGMQHEIEEKENFAAKREVEIKHLTDQMTGKCHELEIQIGEFTRTVKMKDESIKKLLNDKECCNDQLLSRNNELARYRAEITKLDNKMCELIATIKETLGIVEGQIDKPTTETTETEISALVQLSQIGADLEEFRKIGHYIASFRNQMIKMQQDLDSCERSHNTISAKCRGLSDQNAYLQVERDEANEKLLTLQQQLQMEKESNEKLSKMLMNVEAKYEELASKPNRSSLSNRRDSDRYMLTTGTMTVISSHDFVELTDKAKTLSSFTKRMYALAAQWNNEAAVNTGISYHSIDLDHLYQTYARILNRLSDGLDELRDKITSDRAKLQSVISEEQQNSQQTKFNSMASSEAELQIQGQAVRIFWLRLPSSLEMDHKMHNADVLEVLSKMRSLRSQLDWFCRYSNSEKTKENVAPMESLQLENERLQAVLTDARILLQRAHERLSKLPNSKEMCEQILREMNEISKAMKATTREVRRVGSRSRGAKGYT
uniref:Uncharacterized protein n=1 Tax=Setaria digitata TaxID=48799 RepID=A0A915PZY3_9BILA